MSKVFVADSQQLCLVPSDPGFWLPKDHVARFFNELVESELDLSAIEEPYKKRTRRGRPHYDPVMLLKIVLYGYSVGITSNRGIAQSCVDRVDFRYLSGGLTPGYRTIAKFRRRHAKVLAELFQQTLGLAVEAGLVEMKQVAFDGTKILANASKRKAMSYERMCREMQKLHQEIESLRRERKCASTRKRKVLESEIKFKRKRLTKIQEGRFELEDRSQRDHGMEPKAKDQLNFTDRDSRIMKKGSGFEQCYNAQAAVDKGKQIILAAFVTQAGNDKQMLEPLADGVVENIGVLPDEGLADAGYFSEAAALSLKEKYPETEWLIAPGRLEHGHKAVTPRGRIPKDISVADRMRRSLNTKAGKASYAQRKAIVEPVFGQIKEANLEFRRFSYRGYEQVNSEWLLVCAVHNLLKIFRHRRSCESLLGIRSGRTRYRAA